jgi:3-deoxy-D-arabino-heptulosonate 7-phosphate (DAHP) synthase class II
MVTFAKKEVQGSHRREETLKRYRTEMANQFETNRRHIDQFEKRVTKDYRDILIKILRDFSVPKELEQDLEVLSKRGVEQALEKDLRIPVKEIYEAEVKRLPPP